MSRRLIDKKQNAIYHEAIKVIMTILIFGKEADMEKVSVAHLKSHLSELIAKSSHSHERFVITRRNKPVAALVSLDDLRVIEQHEERQGLASLAGKWQDFEEIAENLEDIEQLRKNGGKGRDVSL